MSKYSALLFFFSFFLGSYTSVHAAQVNKIYSASVPIASQQKHDRLSGFDQALSIVLVKASGQYAEVTQSRFINAFLPAEPLVQTFSYRENPDYQEFVQNQSEQDQSEQDDADAPDVSEKPDNLKAPLPYLLDVSFAQSTVEERMIKHSMPIWGSVRPSVIVWVAHEQNGERSIVGTSDTGELVENLLRLGESRGVPLYLPVADLQDVSAVEIDDLWGLFPESVDQASKRYHADAVVMMRVYQSDNGLWSGNWSLDLKQTLETGAKYGSALPQLLEAMVSDLAAKLSSHYAISIIPGEEGGVLHLEVGQVDTFAKYIEVQRYLSSLPPVSAMKVDWVRSGRAGYQVTLVGSKNQFFQHVDLGGQLRKDLRSQLLAEQAKENEEAFGLDLLIEEPPEAPTLLFDTPALEQDIYTNDTEYYIWSSGNTLFLDNVQNIDKK